MNSTTTELMSLLIEEKPTIFSPSDNALHNWKRTWMTIIYELPRMWKNKETYVYYHYASKNICAGKVEEIEQQYKVFEEKGLKRAEDEEVNEQNIYCILHHPKKKKMGLKCEFEFERYYKEDEENPLPMCPILWGINAMGDGFTYVKVKFSEVEIPKDKAKIAMDLVNGKFEKAIQ